MVRKLFWVNLTYVFSIFIMLVYAAIAFQLDQSSCIEECPLANSDPTYSQPQWSLSPQAYDNIGTYGAFALCKTKLHIKPPALKDSIRFMGVNQRPDRSCVRECYLQLSEQVEQACREGETTYLAIQSSDYGSKHFIFSPDNQPTGLALQPKFLSDKEIEISIFFEPVEGYELPDLHPYSFSLYQEENRIPSTWYVDQARVDHSLLMRQRARWVGRDSFLEKYGGEEFLYTMGKERIDFCADEGVVYSCFVSENSSLVWKDHQWCSEEQTQGYPLLVVRKIEEQNMICEIWDCSGLKKVTANLIKVKDGTFVPNIEHEFKFIGAKTWGQFILDHRGQRWIVKPHDWLVYIDNQWRKIESAEEVDLWVNQQLYGPLLIIDNIIKKEGHSYLRGELVTANHTQIYAVELPSVYSATTSLSFNSEVP